MPTKIQADGGIFRISFYGKCTKADLGTMANELLRLEAGLERVPDRLTDVSGIEERGGDEL